MARGAGAAVAALVRFGHKRPWTVVISAVLVAAAGVLLGMRIRFETDVLALLPRNDRVVTEFKELLQEFGTLDVLLVAVPVQSEDRLEDALGLVDRVADHLAKSPHISNVQAHVEDPMLLAETVLRHGVLFLDAEGLAALEQRLSDKGLAARAQDIRTALDAPLGMVAKEFALRDPLGFLPMLLSRLNRTPANLKVDFSSGYYLSADHAFVLVLAKPTGAAQDIDFDEQLFADLKVRIRAARTAFAQDSGVKLAEVPEPKIGGGHRIALEDATLIKRDIATNSLGSVVGVLILFFLAYRRFATAHYAFLPLAAGMALTFIFAALALGTLNSATSGFAALLVGLGIDFTIVMYGRYLEGRRAGLDISAALDQMARQTGPGVALGATTTVGTFYAFLVSRFVGLREFGLLTGTGIVLMAFSAFLLLPALVTIFDRRKAAPAATAWFRMGGVLAHARGARTPILWTAAVITLATAVAVPFVRFDDDVRNLRSPSNRGIVIQEEVAKAFGLSFNSMMVRIEAATVPAALEKARELAKGLDVLVRANVISSYETVGNLVPPPAAQARALAWLGRHPELTDPARVRKSLEKELAEHGLVASAFAPGLGVLDETLRPKGPISIDMWNGTPVQQLVDRSVRVHDGKVITVVNVFSPPGMWRRDAPPELEQLVSTVPGASLTGINLVARSLRRTVWVDATLACALGFVLVLIVLLLQLKSLRDSVFCLLPVGVGLIWTVGFMAIAGWPLNLLNVFVMTMIIGVGSDYAIYMTYRLRETGDPALLGETARAVLLAALSTIVGFGSLVTTHYPGLQSMGWVASLGVSFAILAAVILLPLLVRRRERETRADEVDAG